MFFRTLYGGKELNKPNTFSVVFILSLLFGLVCKTRAQRLIEQNIIYKTITKSNGNKLFCKNYYGMQMNS
ncbi:MAG: hypothetical protein DHS20C13_08750 [Thermodesulfobacteriota bacterium]|nr:MAG: hypothetical protein DHS20C13_08750 [Thermodesulfobacteriota bacterium]